MAIAYFGLTAMHLLTFDWKHFSLTLKYSMKTGIENSNGKTGLNHSEEKN